MIELTYFSSYRSRYKWMATQKVPEMPGWSSELLTQYGNSVKYTGVNNIDGYRLCIDAIASWISPRARITSIYNDKYAVPPNWIPVSVL